MIDTFENLRYKFRQLFHYHLSMFNSLQLIVYVRETRKSANHFIQHRYIRFNIYNIRIIQI